MKSRTEAREFLKSRRAKLSPPSPGPASDLRSDATTDTPSAPPSRSVRRRVPGLRREEVAALAGVSVDYYTRLEKGRLESASPAVLDAIARALQLDSAERSHLQSLARASRGESGTLHPEATDGGLRPQLRWLLDAMGRSPAYVRNGRLDVLAHNGMGRALYKPMFDGMGDRPNLALFCFLDGRGQELFPQWPEVAAETVGLLRAETGRHPSDAVTTDLVERLLQESGSFRELWASHDVRRILAESKEFAHPEVGPLTLALEALEVSADPGLTMVAYAAQPGSQSEEGLNLLSRTAGPATPGQLTLTAQFRRGLFVGDGRDPDIGRR